MYTLLYPFKLWEGQILSESDFNKTFEQLDLTLKFLDLTLDLEKKYYVLEVKGFKDSASAESFLPRVQSALIWLLIRRGLVSEAVNNLQPVKTPDDPRLVAIQDRTNMGMDPVEGEELHGFLDALRPAVILTNGTYQREMALPITLSTGPYTVQVWDILTEGLSYPGSDRVIEDQRFATALDLFRAHYMEVSSRAKFLTLVMVLEALAEPRDRPAFIIKLLEQFHNKLEEEKRLYKEISPELEALESLKQELHFRTKDSISSSVRFLVSRALHDQDSEIMQNSVESVRRIYDLRSKITHGKRVEAAEINVALTEALEIVKKVLSVNFLEIANRTI